MSMEKEESIESEILCYFLAKWILAWKNDIKWFYNQNKWFYQKNKSRFIRNWISDITALHRWTHIAIEVKKPSEMSFFDRTISDLRVRYAKAQIKGTNPKKYLHAIEQREFLNDVIKNWWVWFFASSVDEVIEKLKIKWIII